MVDTDMIFGIGATVISLLLGGNIFFLKRLVERIESTGDKASAALRATEEQARTLTDLKSTHNVSMAELRSEIKDMRRIEIDVAVLKSAISYRGGSKNNGGDKPRDVS